MHGENLKLGDTKFLHTHCSLSQCWIHCSSDNIVLKVQICLCVSQPTSISSLQSCTHLCHFCALLITGGYFKDATQHFFLQADSSFCQLCYIWAPTVLLSYISLFFKISIPTINDFPFLRNIHVRNTWITHVGLLCNVHAAGWYEYILLHEYETCEQVPIMTPRGISQRRPWRNTGLFCLINNVLGSCPCDAVP